MGRSPSQGLTAYDFHHQPYVNPLDVFPKSRLANRSQTFRPPIRTGASSRSPSRFSIEPLKYACCGEDDEDDLCARASGGHNYCTDYDDLTTEGNSSKSGEEIRHNSPSVMDCKDCVDDCEDCEDEHQQFNQHKVDAGPGEFLDDCAQCHHDEHDKKCHEGECDFSCFDCIDWNEFEKDKSLGLSYSVPLLGDTTFPTSEASLEGTDLMNFQLSDIPSLPSDLVAPPLDLPMHHQCFGSAVPYWSNLPPTQICTGPPTFAPQLGQYPLPPFGLEYGCHPAIAHQQTAKMDYQLASTPAVMAQPPPDSKTIPDTQMQVAQFKSPLLETKDLLSAVLEPSTSRACQWLMPCGTVCGASFASAVDLKKHLKAVHLVKGVVKCGWQDCDSAEFASEAALTGHISKKHLAPLISQATAVHGARNSDGSTDAGAFKCTFPGCPKSFMYKQVRDEHVASCHNGNKMYCHICGQFLNGEGSNFKRHMATHRPKHQHMLCKFNDLGCKRRFPRLDNLRRHEACCKFGKKAALLNSGVPGVVDAGAQHHHHHHKHGRKLSLI